MEVLKNRFKEVEGNKWITGDRDREVEKEIEKLSPPWVGYKVEVREMSIEERREEMNKEITL